MPEPILFKVFCQANTIKGWRYLDDAGRIMNLYADQFPDLSVGLRGLVMKNPTAVVEEARVSGNDIWIGFARPATTQLVQDHAWRYVTTVSDIIDVTSYSRVGVRFQYLREVASVAKAMPRLAAVVLGPALTSLGESPGSVEGKIEVTGPDGLDARVSVTFVRAADPTADPALPSEGLMLDADISRTSTMTRVEVRRTLQAALAWGDTAMKGLAERIAQEATG